MIRFGNGLTRGFATDILGTKLHPGLARRAGFRPASSERGMGKRRPWRCSCEALRSRARGSSRRGDAPRPSYAAASLESLRVASIGAAVSTTAAELRGRVSDSLRARARASCRSGEETDSFFQMRRLISFTLMIGRSRAHDRDLRLLDRVAVCTGGTTTSAPPAAAAS